MKGERESSLGRRDNEQHVIRKGGRGVRDVDTDIGSSEVQENEEWSFTYSIHIY